MDSIANLRKALTEGGNSPPELVKPRWDKSHTFDYAVWRFAHARRGSALWRPDDAVLLRQAVRWAGGPLQLGRLPEGLEVFAERAGVFGSISGSLTASPYHPDWLRDEGVHPDHGIDSRPEERSCREELVAEPYLGLLGYGHWRSAAQKEAAWLATTAPVGSTTLITLPTGAGKSLCYQILTRFTTGLTVVIVPTVALALDQWRSSLEVFKAIPDLHPVCFVSSDPDQDPDGVVESVKAGRARLLFTSPEACVSGRLRTALEEAAKSRRLEYLVIDEAHLIDSWGASFRVDFQMLSALRRKWHEGDGVRLRTLLLSATVTPSCKGVLQGLFAGPGEWREFINQRLRPEMTYYVRSFESEIDRHSAVLQCAWRLPRPAIFYTTEVKKAQELHRILSQEQGFSRTGCFHGETPQSERRDLLSRWRDDEIDLMVATSAFGLGVDKADVRAVVHACMPEDLNRYYQEVGRGGRDGNSSVCLLLPTNRDITVAKGLARRLLKPDTLQQRWEALWKTKEEVSAEQHIWRLRLDARRLSLKGTRTWDENVRWNGRLILQLRRADMLDLLDVGYGFEKEGETTFKSVTVKLKFPPGSNHVGEGIAAVRQEELDQADQGFTQFLSYLKGDKCLSAILRGVFGEQVQRVCGGCPVCRRRGAPLKACPRLEFDVRANSHKPEKLLILSPHPFQDRGKFGELLRGLIDRKSIQRFVCDEHIREKLLGVFAELIPPEEPLRYRLDGWSPESRFVVLPSETVAFLHVPALSESGLQLNAGRLVAHLVPPGVSYCDANERYVLESEGARLVPRWAQWVKER